MVKINSLTVENIKRVKAVQMEPNENGLTVIGGKNGQGKTSVLDAIAWALGGDRFRPSSPNREGSVIPPHLKVELSNGIIVERSGDKGSLKVIDPTGNKGGQQLLNEFIEQLALDLPRFMQSTAKEKAKTLLNIIGVGEKLYELDNAEQQLYNRRTEIGRIADQKAKFAKEMPMYSDVPKEPISVTDLIKQQQDILAKNGENQRKREALSRYKHIFEEAAKALERARQEYERACSDFETASKSAEDLQDESTSELEKNISDIELINTRVRANLEREHAELEAEGYRRQYEDLTDKIETVRKQKADLLNNADLPLEGLFVEDGELLYHGHKWDSMSGSEQLKVSTAIVRRLNPNCGFVLMDKLEQMDRDTLSEFGKWLESEGLQVIATRVSTGEECSLIIEDGSVQLPKEKTWKVGSF